MKPHEEEWTAACPETNEHMGPSIGLFADEDVLFGEIYTQECDRTALVLAAPDMARALLDALRNGGSAKWMEDGAVVDLHERIRAALTKAGVLP